MFDFLFPFPQPFQQRDAEAQADDKQITDAESDTCLSLYLGAGCTEIRSQMDVRVRYLQQPLQLGHQRPHGAAGPAIGLRHGSRVLPGKDHGQTQWVDSHPPPGPSQRPLQALPQVRQRRADILEAQRELFPLLGRLLLLLCFSLGFLLLLGLLLCLRLFRPGQQRDAGRTGSQPVGSRLLAKGEARICLLYRTQDGSLHTWEDTLPFSCLLDGLTVPEEAQVTVTGSCGTARLIRSDGAAAIGVELTLSLLVRTYETVAVAPVTDLYSTRWDTALQRQSLTLTETWPPETVQPEVRQELVSRPFL